MIPSPAKRERDRTDVSPVFRPVRGGQRNYLAFKQRARLRFRRFFFPFRGTQHTKKYPLLQGEGRVRMGSHRSPVAHMNPILTLTLSLKERDFLCLLRSV